MVFQDNVEGSDMDLLNMLQNEVNELIELEELKWHQMSKHEWLQHGMGIRTQNFSMLQ
jgi:hypothetical protein